MRDLTCKQFIEFLDDYFAGNQEPDVRATFESHLRVCRHCTDYLQSYRQTIELARGAMRPSHEAVPPETPEDLVRAVMAATARRPPDTSR